MIKTIIKIVAMTAVMITLALSFFRFFPSYEHERCPDGEGGGAWSEDGTVLCPNQVNFWQYLVDLVEAMR